MVSAEICDCINRLVVSLGGHAKSSYALNGVAGARKASESGRTRMKAYESVQKCKRGRRALQR